MRIYDITHPISSKLPIWPGSMGYKVHQHLTLPKDVNNLTSITIDCHLGTHLDAPSHFVYQGNTIEDIPLDILIGKAYVIELYKTNRITADDLFKANMPVDCTRLLLKTDNQKYWEAGMKEFQKDFCALDETAATWIVNQGIKLIGIDYLSIQKFEDGPATHQILLKNEVVIVESLKLDAIQQGWYDLVCLPIKLEGLEGAPVRAILKKEDGQAGI